MGMTVRGHWSAWAYDGTPDELLAEMTLAAEGMTEEERQYYWEFVGATLSQLVTEGDRTIYVDVHPDGAESCDFCGARAEEALDVLALTQQTRATACPLCVHLLPEAGERFLVSLSLSLTETAWAVLEERYPGAHERPTYAIADAAALRDVLASADSDDVQPTRDELLAVDDRLPEDPVPSDADREASKYD